MELKIMAVHLLTKTPAKLLESFKEAIKKGRVVTWAYDADGDFTHTPEQWKNAAWFRPAIQSGRLVMRIVKPQGKILTREVYGIYHGRIIESISIHCHTFFSEAFSTAEPTSEDILS